jgi:HJR/Mrr/RecB family endonuclease
MAIRFSAKNLGYLIDTIFGVRDGPSGDQLSAPLFSIPEILPIVSETIDEVLATLTPREEKVIKMRFGLGSSELINTQNEVGFYYAVTRNRISQIESKALRKLRHPSRAKRISRQLTQILDSADYSKPNVQELQFVVQKITRLTPDLIKHLQKNEDDLLKLNPYVFEHLIAEFFARWGFDVSLVGQNSRTAADIYAAKIMDPIGVEHRYFIEVKRWRDRVGIEVIERVIGAMLLEKEKFGWHAGLIVTAGGFKDFKRWTKQQLDFKGISLMDKDNLLKHLQEYEPNANGLYLPSPKKVIF